MAAFLADHPEFFPEPLALPAGIAEDAPGMVTLLPHKHGTDGFYTKEEEDDPARKRGKYGIITDRTSDKGVWKRRK